MHFFIIELKNLGAEVFEDTWKLCINYTSHLFAVVIVKQTKLYAYVFDDPLFRFYNELSDSNKKLLDQRHNEFISTQKVRQSVKNKFCN